MILVNQNGNLVIETDTIWYEKNEICCLNSSNEKVILGIYLDETSAFFEFDDLLDSLREGNDYYELKPYDESLQDEAF